MKSFSTFALACGLLLAGALSAPNVSAQMSPVVMAKEASQKPVWLKAEVVRFGLNSMTVRVAGDEMRILTFTYAPGAQPQVQKALDNGGYQYDDKIKIRYIPGTTVALRVRGKLSHHKVKPANPPLKPTAPLRKHPTPAGR
jgi:hypothetical protein